MTPESLLQIGKALLSCQRLDGVEPPTLGLYREHQAAAAGTTVDAHRAGTAHAMLTAHVRAGGPQLVAQEVTQLGAGLGVAAALATIEG
jgi:hypothetical protein